MHWTPRAGVAGRSLGSPWPELRPTGPIVRRPQPRRVSTRPIRPDVVELRHRSILAIFSGRRHGPDRSGLHLRGVSDEARHSRERPLLRGTSGALAVGFAVSGGRPSAVASGRHEGAPRRAGFLPPLCRPGRTLEIQRGGAPFPRASGTGSDPEPRIRPYSGRVGCPGPCPPPKILVPVPVPTG